MRRLGGIWRGTVLSGLTSWKLNWRGQPLAASPGSHRLEVRSVQGRRRGSGIIFARDCRAGASAGLRLSGQFEAAEVQAVQTRQRR